MKFKKLLLTFVFLIGSLLGLTSCKQEVLTVYTEVGFAPFEYVSNGEISAWRILPEQQNEFRQHKNQAGNNHWNFGWL